MTKAKAKGLKCPLLGGKCIEGDCVFWIHVKGKNPQDDTYVDKHACSWVWLPLLHIEHTKEQRQGNEKIDQLKKEVSELRGVVQSQNIQMGIFKELANIPGITDQR